MKHVMRWARGMVANCDRNTWRRLYVAQWTFLQNSTRVFMCTCYTSNVQSVRHAVKLQVFMNPAPPSSIWRPTMSTEWQHPWHKGRHVGGQNDGRQWWAIWRDVGYRQTERPTDSRVECWRAWRLQWQQGAACRPRYTYGAITMQHFR